MGRLHQVTKTIKQTNTIWLETAPGGYDGEIRFVLFIWKGVRGEGETIEGLKVSWHYVGL